MMGGTRWDKGPELVLTKKNLFPKDFRCSLILVDSHHLKDCLRPELCTNTKGLTMNTHTSLSTWQQAGSGSEL